MQVGTAESSLMDRTLSSQRGGVLIGMTFAVTILLIAGTANEIIGFEQWIAHPKVAVGLVPPIVGGILVGWLNEAPVDETMLAGGYCGLLISVAAFGLIAFGAVLTGELSIPLELSLSDPGSFVILAGFVSVTITPAYGFLGTLGALVGASFHR